MASISGVRILAQYCTISKSQLMREASSRTPQKVEVSQGNKNIADHPEFLSEYAAVGLCLKKSKQTQRNFDYFVYL